MDTGLRRRLDAALKESGFCLASLERSEHAITIRTPFIMPDGDYMDFYANPKTEGGWIITDFGDTAGLCLFIRAYTGSIPDSYLSEIQAVLREYGTWYAVKFENGVLRLEVADDRLADALRHFAQMVLHVAQICSFGDETVLDTGMTTETSV